MKHYNIFNIIWIISMIDQSKKDGALVIQHLLDHVEQGLEEIQPGGSVKFFCCRSTFDRYLKLVRDHAPNGIAKDLSPFRGIMKPFSEAALHLMVEYLERVKPGILDNNPHA